MNRLRVLSVVVVLLPGVALAAEAWRQYSYPYGPYGPYGQQSSELTIEEQRKLGLSEEQIQKIAELRRGVESERVKLDAQLKAANAAAAAANADVARINQEIRELSTVKLQKIYETVLTEAQRKAMERQRLLDQAKGWLRGYQTWLKLTDAQMDDIANLLVPVFEKYGKAETEVSDAREQLSELRRAEKLDIAAIDKAEKEVDALSKRNVYQARQDELMDKMRVGLLPDQLEKLGQMRRH